ncbi:MAG: OsmC family protein [Anaerolineales bacterium]
MDVTARNEIGYQVEIEAAGHHLHADESPEGGPTSGPDPYALLLASLGACKAMTVRMYANRKGWPLETINVSLSIHKMYARDCEDCESDADAKVDIIEEELSFEGDLTDEQRERLAWIADRCPVHRTLTSETKIRRKVGA